MRGHSPLKTGVTPFRPRIHVFLSARQVVDGRVKPGHDEHKDGAIVR
jgi:hypothetical protein